MDYVNGNDAARTTFAPTNYSNNGSGLVRVNRTAHGLVTGAVIDISGSGVTAYNQAWKITRIDADNFDLDTSTFTSNPATKGTVAPRGGSSWSDAWLTTSSGATSSRVAAGDTVRIAKTGDPVSIGNGTWTNNSPTVTLATAQTATIDNCETAWTAANSGTITRVSGAKQGSFYMRVTVPASPATNTLYGYYPTGTLDLSAYQEITLWLRSSSNPTASNWTIRLCSDTAGATTVDTFNVPALNLGNFWYAIRIVKNGGGNLGNNIQSIAVYSGSVAPTGSTSLELDNISASKTDGLNLTTLISKNSAASGGTDTWHGLQFINGTTVRLGQLNGDNEGASQKGYITAGTSPETVTTYARKTLFQRSTISAGGSTSAQVLYSGGWDTSTNTQNGETWVDGTVGQGAGYTVSSNYVTLARLHGTRFFALYNSAAQRQGVIIDAICCNTTNAVTLFFSTSDIKIQSNNCNSSINGAGFSTPAVNTLIQNIISKANTSADVIQGSNLIVNNCESYTSGGYSIQGVTGPIFIGNLLVNNATVSGSNIGLQAGATSNGYKPYPTYIYNATITNCTTGIDYQFGALYINKLTASGNTNIGGANDMIVKQMNSSTSQLLGSNMSFATAFLSQPSVFYNAINNVQTDNRAFWTWGNALSQTTTRKSATGIAWQINITNTLQTTTFPIYFPIAKIACNANTQVTVKAWVKLSNATNIGAKLTLRAYEIAGVNADVTATKSADTNWEELTITFTPTMNAVAQIYLQAYWLASTANQSVFVDDITVTQA